MKNRPPEGINTVTSLGLGTTPRVATWLLRSLIQTESYSDRFHGYRFGQLVKRLGLMKEQFDDEKKPEVFLEALLRQLEALEMRVGEGDAEDPVFRNVDRIAAMLNLTETERDLLAFGVLTHFDTEFQECFDELRGPTFGAIAEMLAGIVGHSSKEIRAALRADSMLSQAGLMSARPFAERQSSNPLEVPAEIAGALVLEHRDEESLLRCLFQPAPAPRLDQVDFSYLEADIDILGGFLSAAVAQHKPGVNVLMHGAPGLGKTELARTLVAGLDVALFEVNITAIDGEPIRPASRITAYRTAQHILQRRAASVLLFDEMEDVFPSESNPLAAVAERPGKGWTNQLLESNPVPAIWISNAIHQLDHAYLRRFSFVIEVPAPPRHSRHRILANALGSNGVDRSWIAQLAEEPRITPADVENAARIVTAMGADWAGRAEQVVDHVLSSNLRARGVEIDTHRRRGDTDFDVSLANTEANLEALIGACGRNLRGRICLYGPPGTGKTAFVRYLTHRIGVELVEKRASDLLGKYVGENEANIARMFREAREEKAVLLLDEADSFLRSRRLADRLWEVSEVNEMLVQMERFEGLFFCCTNRVEELDEAVFRRFDLKIELGYLDRVQRRLLFDKMVLDHGICMKVNEAIGLQRRLDQLTAVSAGDFAVLKRRHELTGGPGSAEELVNELEQECRLKGVENRALGFGSH